MRTIVERTRAARLPTATWCSLVAASACAAIPFFELALPEFDASHGWIFVLGTAAFASNLSDLLPPYVRALAALAQAVCTFEIIGLSVGLTVLAFAATHIVGSLAWWGVAIGWGVVGACLAATGAASSCALRTLAIANPE